jgi:tellurite resistance protein
MWLGQLSQTQRLALLDLAHNVVVSDGLLDPNEEGMLAEFKAEMGLPVSHETGYLPLEGVDKVFPDRRTRVVALINLLRLSYADGAFEIEEECLLKEVSRVFGIRPDEFLLMDNWVRRWLLLQTEARALMT